MTSPVFRATRIRRVLAPAPSTRMLMRVGTPPGVSSITFETWMVLSFSAIPPLICRDGIRTGVALDHLHALDQDPAGVAVHFEDASRLALILAADHPYGIVLPDAN